MVKWTPEQQTAIQEEGSDILVAAAAGSGKTAVLVERIIQKMIREKNPYSIDELLVVTFTNAAAEEMRQRIRIALERALQKQPNSYHLKKQVSLVQRAAISTLHSFCMNVVRQYSYLIDLDPAFRIADDMEIDLIKHEVMDELLEQLYSQEGEKLEQFLTLVDMFSSDRSDVQIEQLVTYLHTFAKQHPYPEQWLSEVAATYDVDEQVDEAELEWLQILKIEIAEQLQSFADEIERAMLITKESDGPTHYGETFQEDLKLIRQAQDVSNEWEKLQAFMETAKFKTLSTKRVECNLKKRERAKAIRDQVRKNWNDVKERWFKRDLKHHLQDMQKLYPIVKTLTEIVLLFEEQFQAVKRERAIVDFNDLEHFTLQILLDETSNPEKIVPSSIAESFKAQFKELLVDEYQDINLVQETILQAIRNDNGAGNMFMVGDVKQSIYRFRHAEPTLFIDKYERFAKAQSTGQRIDLAKNFRSRQMILHGANYIFRQIFDETIGEIAYDDRAALIFGNESYVATDQEHHAVEVLLIRGDSEEDDSFEGQANDEALDELTKVQLEASVYASKIKDWIGTDEKQPTQVIDKKTNELRDITYKDIVILLRSLTDAPTIAEELKKQGIPVYAELKTGYFKAIEIQIMLNMLKIIDNPYQDIPFVSVLRSPIVQLNEEHLTQIKLANKKGSFFEAAQAYGALQEETSERVKQFLQQLARFRKLARERSLSELIWTIFQETGYYDYVGGIPGGRQRQANLRALYDRARRYEETSFRGLFRFLRFIERMEEKEKDLGEARALSEQEDVVRIMTIHRSKGLEFPVVILGNINKQFNLKDLQGNGLASKTHGFATKFIDPVKRISYNTLYYTAVNVQEKLKMLSEEMRVLYVALTRAKEKLVLVGYVKALEKEMAKWQEIVNDSASILPNQLRKNAKSYLDWIGPAIVRHEQAALLRPEMNDISHLPVEISNDTSRWRVEIVAGDQIAKEAQTQPLAKHELQTVIEAWDTVPYVNNEKTSVNVAERLQFEYPYQVVTESRAKQSVTEIKRRLEMEDEYSDNRLIKKWRTISHERPQFLQKEKSLTRAEIGTAMHTVMQHIPLTKQWDSVEIKVFIENLVVSEKLTEAEKDAIDVVAIERFFTTPLATLMVQNDVRREVPFSYTVDAKEVYADFPDDLEEKVFIQGVIDCLIFTDDGVILVDYKTDAIVEDEVTEQLKHELKERYRVQISLYKQAIEDILQTKVSEAYFYYFAKDLLIEM